MSIEVLTEALAQLSKPRAVGAASRSSRTTPQKRRDVDETKSDDTLVSLDAREELNELVKLVAQAPSGLAATKLEDISSQVQSGDYTPGLERTARMILAELKVLPDPPYDTLP